MTRNLEDELNQSCKQLMGQRIAFSYGPDSGPTCITISKGKPSIGIYVTAHQSDTTAKAYQVEIFSEDEEKLKKLEALIARTTNVKTYPQGSRFAEPCMFVTGLVGDITKKSTFGKDKKVGERLYGLSLEKRISTDAGIEASLRETYPDYVPIPNIDYSAFGTLELETQILEGTEAYKSGTVRKFEPSELLRDLFKDINIAFSEPDTYRFNTTSGNGLPVLTSEYQKR